MTLYSEPSGKWIDASRPLPPGWTIAKKSPEIVMVKAMQQQREIRMVFLNTVFMRLL
ncbi:MAG: hypothetical protein H2077_09390 [Verrucomicrobiales bacterium]|nr:hypothetical protein [Verrucomicrobiales bacterium]